MSTIQWFCRGISACSRDLWTSASFQQMYSSLPPPPPSLTSSRMRPQLLLTPLLSQPDLGLKLYQLFGRTAYSYLETMLVRISGPEEFNGSNSAASREEATALLRDLIQTKGLFETAYRITDKDCELMVRDAKVVLPAPGDAVLLRYGPLPRRTIPPPARFAAPAPMPPCVTCAPQLRLGDRRIYPVVSAGRRLLFIASLLIDITISQISCFFVVLCIRVQNELAPSIG